MKTIIFKIMASISVTFCKWTYLIASFFDAKNKQDFINWQDNLNNISIK